jgi:hypothetical protein
MEVWRVTCEWTGLYDVCLGQRTYHVKAVPEDLNISMVVCRAHLPPAVAWMLGSVPITETRVTLAA